MRNLKQYPITIREMVIAVEIAEAKESARQRTEGEVGSIDAIALSKVANILRSIQRTLDN